MLSIGIDNGLDGAVVVLDNKMRVISWTDTPVIDLGKKSKRKRIFGISAMASIIHDVQWLHNTKRIRAFIEFAQAMPKQGVSSTFKTGLGFGLWQGICAGLGLPFEVIHPRTWTKEMLRDMPAGEPKARSMAKCQQLFPDIPLVKPRGRVLSLDGRADAALIAAYGLRKMMGG
jgi:hypothetical protein